MSSVSLSCPKCDAVLKMASRPAAGKKIKCPKCAALFVAADQLDDENDAPRRPQKKGSSVGLLIGVGLGVGACLLFAAVPAGGVIWWLSSSNKPIAQERGEAPAKQKAEPIAKAPIARPPEKKAEPGTKEPAPPPQKTEPVVKDPPPPEKKTEPVAKGPDTPPDKGPDKTKPKSDPPPPVKTPDPPPQKPAPVTGPVDLDKDLLDKTTKATAFIRVDLGNKTSTGSGFLVKTSGDTAYLITNLHVLALEPDQPAAPPTTPGPKGFSKNFMPGPGSLFKKGPFGPPPAQQAKDKLKVTVVLRSGTPEEQSVPAEVVAVDEEGDLAALRITGARNLPAAIDVSQESDVAETQPVYMFGYPINKAAPTPGYPTITVGKGTIAGLRRDPKNELVDVHINGEINPGNSGGPVIDAKGRLVGIAVATVPGKQIGFAIPADELNQMFKGRLSTAIVFQLKQVGGQLDAIGEIWVHDRKSNVRGREVLSVRLPDDPKGGKIPADEYLVMARLADPMLKIGSTSAHFVAAESVPAEAGAQGWTKIDNATSVALKIQGQSAIGTFKLPPGTVADQTFAFQFSYHPGKHSTHIKCRQFAVNCGTRRTLWCEEHSCRGDTSTRMGRPCSRSLISFA